MNRNGKGRSTDRRFVEPGRLGVAMDYSKIDEAILKVASPHWLKVARILADAARVKGVCVPETDEGYEVILGRIQVLVNEGALVAEGDLEKPRHSEVRLPS